ncbi:MAG TPA: 3-oxoacyl-[acyl-carrier-protein] synthase III C-terminal domain-containing protein [Polyangiaceae bacterium]|nr:3-oxoacyl-[acyl-carrier-protein] synthase III C-terminal domain-containing protein [Polyangiaceae bacterium]
MLALSNFRARRPRHRATQLETLEWLAQAHTRAEAGLVAQQGKSFDNAAFLEWMRRRLRRFGCSSEQITTRGYEIDDCSHVDWRDMEVYDLSERPNGAGMRARSKVFGRVANAAFDELFTEVDSAPQHLIHVTCTGYESPSAAQMLVARKGWGRETRVTHAYHMGCYAALPALRTAAGFCSYHDSGERSRPSRVDIVHTELCSLHMHPLRHDPEQLVVQSLFADGCISYSVSAGGRAAAGGPALAVVSMDEWIVPDSANSMAWFCADFGMEMVLARDVPEKITASLSGFVSSLLAKAGQPEAALESALFAIHPGGPKIVDQIAATLKLSEAQIAFSRAVLREHGNMSSATLPHIWQRIVEAPEVTTDQLVVSLAFGPGLTLSGAVLRKVWP